MGWGLLKPNVAAGRAGGREVGKSNGMQHIQHTLTQSVFTQLNGTHTLTWPKHSRLDSFATRRNLHARHPFVVQREEEWSSDRADWVLGWLCGLYSFSYVLALWMQMNLASGNWVFRNWNCLMRALYQKTISYSYLISQRLSLHLSLSLSLSHHVTPFSGVFTGLLLRVWFLFSSVDFRLLLNKQSVSKRASLQLAWPLFRKICPLLKLQMGNSAHTHTHTVCGCVCAQWVENNLCYVFLITYDGHGAGSIVS